jgi:nicotinate-nucleotide adenylyltransferase
MGGTFDPVHNGHIEAARQLRDLADLDEVWLMPNHLPPHRRAPLASPQHRMRMVEIAVRGHPGLVPSRLEIERGGTSYTIDTLRELESRFPGQRFEFLLGADAAEHIRSWHDAGAILDAASFVIFNRPGTELSREDLAALGFPQPRTRSVHVHTPEVAAHEIRDRISGGMAINDLVAPAVMDYIRARHLYGSRS